MPLGEEAERLEARRTELWNHWNAKVTNAQFLLSATSMRTSDLATARSR